MSSVYTENLNRLIEEFSKLQGVGPKTAGQRRNELINDPAVRTILMGLDATITGIEESE